MASTGNYRYFIYSREQEKAQKEMAERNGKLYRVGYVISGGMRKQVTEINQTGTSRYSDYVIQAEGEITSFTYKRPEGA